VGTEKPPSSNTGGGETRPGAFASALRCVWAGHLNRTRWWASEMCQGRWIKAGDLAHCSDAGQRLAAKAQRADAVHAGEFAGGMMSERQGDLSRGNAAAVVGCSDQAPTAIEALYADIGRASVYRKPPTLVAPQPRQLRCER